MFFPPSHTRRGILAIITLISILHLLPLLMNSSHLNVLFWPLLQLNQMSLIQPVSLHFYSMHLKRRWLNHSIFKWAPLSMVLTYLNKSTRTAQGEEHVCGKRKRVTRWNYFLTPQDKNSLWASTVSIFLLNPLAAPLWPPPFFSPVLTPLVISMLSSHLQSCLFCHAASVRCDPSHWWSPGQRCSKTSSDRQDTKSWYQKTFLPILNVRCDEQ